MNELVLNALGVFIIISFVLLGLAIIQSIFIFLKSKKDLKSFLRFCYQTSFILFFMFFSPGLIVVFDNSFINQLPDSYFVKSYIEFCYTAYHSIFKSNVLMLLLFLFLALLLFLTSKDLSKEIKKDIRWVL